LRLSHLLRRAFNQHTGQFQMDAGSFKAKLRSWADEHRRAARIAGCRPGVKHPLLCLGLDFVRDAWGPVVPIVVDRPLANVVASLNRHGWFRDEQERVEVTARLISARDLALADAAVVRVDFEALRTAPAVVIRRLADQLRLEVTEAQVEAAAESILHSGDVRLGAHNLDPRQHIRDLRLAEVERNPENGESVLRLAQAYYFLGDFVNARKWYARRAEMDGWDEEVYIAMLEVAHLMERLGEPWPNVQDALLKAWEFRPTRAEPLYAIARWYRAKQRFQLGYQFARLAAEIPLPEQDLLFVQVDIYAWRATAERAICAAGIGKHAEAFTLCQRLLARPDIPDGDRQRIVNNRDMCVPTMIDAASAYPRKLVQRLLTGQGDVLVSLVAGQDRTSTEQTLNSFLNCCTDVSRVGRFLLVDAGLSAQDRAMLQKRYGFLEFAHPGPADEPGAQLAHIRTQIYGRFWLHLSQGWRFFVPENFITRLTAILEAEPQVFQVAINFTDAVKLTGVCAAEEAVRRAPNAGRYLLTDVVASGPAMFDTARLDRAGGVRGTDADPIAALGRRAAAAGLRTASLDEVLCLAAA
jgi:tetratricopeptide (TPR) repeat protein